MFPTIQASGLLSFRPSSVRPSVRPEIIRRVPMHEIFFLNGVFPDPGIFKFYGDKLVFMRYIQATLNSGFPNLNIKSPNFTFCKARIKELAVQVIKSSSHQH